MHATNRRLAKFQHHDFLKRIYIRRVFVTNVASLSGPPILNRLAQHAVPEPYDCILLGLSRAV